jgi:hypothetical protein
MDPNPAERNAGMNGPFPWHRIDSVDALRADFLP